MSIRLFLVRGMSRFHLRVFCWVFFGALTITSIAAHLQPRVYESTGVVERVRIVPMIMVNDHKAAKMRTQLTDPIPTLETIDLAAVARRISAADIAQLLMPYGYAADAGISTIVTVLKRNLRISPIRLSFLFKISYRHPDPRVALVVSEILVDEWVAYCAKVHAIEVVEYVSELREIRDVKMKRAMSERDEIIQSLAAVQKMFERAAGDRSESTNAYIEQLNANMRRNTEWLGSIDREFENKSVLVREMPLRILDRPVLAGGEQYIRSPVMKVLQWRLLFAALVGLLAAVWAGRRNEPAGCP